jgi:DNA processing protein
MITAHFANEYNRTVFAVPGSINFAASAGTNQLIRDGATLVTSTDEITEEFEFLFPQPKKNEKKSPELIPNLDGNEKILYELITEPVSIDQLAEKSDVSIEKVTTALLMLELKGLIRMLPGKIYDRK